jgi:MoxR-like ATPase
LVDYAGENYKLVLFCFVEQEGTYPLPEAQLDRFMFANLEYLLFEEEVLVTNHFGCSQ